MSRSVYPRIHGGKRLARSGGSAPAVTPVSIEARISDGDTANASSYTFSGLTVADGTAVVALYLRKAAGPDIGITSVTINDGGGAEAMSLIGSALIDSGTHVYKAFFGLEGFTGSTAEIVVTPDDTSDRCAIDGWFLGGAPRLADMTVKTAFDAASGASLDVSVDETENGAILAFGSVGPAGTSFTWTGLTEQSDRAVEPIFSAADKLVTTAAASQTKTATYGASAAVRAIIALEVLAAT